MDRLMDFVFGNLVFIVIAIGVLTSLISRLRGDGDPAGKRPGMPPFGGEGPFGSPMPGPMPPSRPAAGPRRVPDVRPARMDEGAPGSPAYPPIVDEAPARTASPPMVERPEPASFSPAPAETTAPRTVPASTTGRTAKRPPGTAVRAASTPREAIGFPVEVDPQRQALQGMIWSEILGTPRALRPHASVRHRRGR